MGTATVLGHFYTETKFGFSAPDPVLRESGKFGTGLILVNPDQGAIQTQVLPFQK
jgi:hypothetical protein